MLAAIVLAATTAAAQEAPKAPSAPATVPAKAPAPQRPSFPMPPKADLAPDAPIGQIVFDRIFARPQSCMEHYATDGLPYAGDALGTDCMAQSVPGEDDVGFARLYRTDGAANEDWYGWHVPVHSPVSGKVIGLLANPTVNAPGSTGRPPAGMLMIATNDGATVVLAHIDAVTLKVGDAVLAGQIVGRVGNNGFARAPHIHLGAYRGATPLQIRWNQRSAVEDSSVPERR